MSTPLVWAAFAALVLATVRFDGVSAKVCYFGQEPDPSHSGRYRWLIPGTHEDHCKCTSIRPGGVNPRAQDRPYKPYFTDQPLFTTDVEEIHDYFECHGTTTDAPRKTTDLPRTTAGEQDTTTNKPGTTTTQPTTTTDPMSATDQPSTTTVPIGTTADQSRATTHQPIATTDHLSTTTDQLSTTAGHRGLTTKGSDDRPTDCQSLFDAGTNTSGVYTIYPSQYPDGLPVYCDMKAGCICDQDMKGGWIVFQRRQDGTVNFTRNWADYREGFGNLTREFWLGNEKLRQLTGEGEWELLVELVAANDRRSVYGLYKSFRVTGDNYNLNAKYMATQPNGCSGNIGDSLSAHSGQNFSTYDRDNDGEDDINCADQCKGGWWFGRCRLYWGDANSNLNGEYSDAHDWSETCHGIAWDQFDGKGQIVNTEMKIRKTETSR